MAMVQYNSSAIEEAAKGNPFTIWVTPETRNAVLYYRSAALALIELADRIRHAIPDAVIAFKPDPVMTLIGTTHLPLDDNRAREEWGWRHEYDLDGIIAAVIDEVRGA